MNLEALYTRLERPGDLLVLTANDGLARTLQQNFCRIAKNKRAPCVAAAENYIPQNFAKEWLPRQESVRHRLLLDADQSAIVWANCIRETSRDILFDARTTAQLARQAENFGPNTSCVNPIFRGGTTRNPNCFFVGESSFGKEWTRAVGGLWNKRRS